MTEQRPNPEQMYVGRETVSLTLSGPNDFATIHMGQRYSSKDPLVRRFPQWFVLETDVTSGQLEREAKERQIAAVQAEHDQREAERIEAERLAVEQREQARIAAQGRVVQVYPVPPYTPEQANPLSERALHPMAHIALGIAAATGDRPPDIPAEIVAQKGDAT